MADEKASPDPLHVVTAISDVAATAQEVALRAEALAKKWELTERPWTERIADLRWFAAEVRAARRRLIVGAKKANGSMLLSAEEAEKKARPMMMVDFETEAITLAPVEEPLTHGQRAVLEAADEWERAGGLGLGTGAHTAKLIDAVRELREVPEAIRINSGEVTEEQRREFLQTLKAHAAVAHPMPEGAGVPLASVRVDAAMPLGTMRFEPCGDAPSVTVTNLGPFRGELEVPLESITIHGDEAVQDALGQLRELRVESVERVGPPSPGIQRIECAVKVVQTSALNHSGEGVSYPLINRPPHQDQAEALVGEAVQTSAPTAKEERKTIGLLTSDYEAWSARKEALAVDGRLAECLFVAYNEQGPNPWKTWDGKDVPRWPALSDQVREKWRAVARASARLQEEAAEKERDGSVDDVRVAAELAD